MSMVMPDLGMIMIWGASMVRASALFIRFEWDYLRGFFGSYKKRANV